MDEVFELWDGPSGNRVEAFADERAALAALAADLADEAADYLASFGLLARRGRADVRLIAEGPALVELVRSAGGEAATAEAERR